MDVLKRLTEAGIKCHLTYYRPLDRNIWPEEDKEGYWTRHDLNINGLTGRSYSPRGGETRAVITMPSGREYVGVAMCSKKDNFSRMEGRNWALLRALENALVDIGRSLQQRVGATQAASFVVDCNGICTSLWPDSRCPKHGFGDR